MNEAVAIVEITHEQYRLAMEEYRRKRQSYIQSIEFALEQGVTYTEIGRRLGMTRQRVYNLVHAA